MTHATIVWTLKIGFMVCPLNQCPLTLITLREPCPALLYSYSFCVTGMKGAPTVERDPTKEFPMLRRAATAA